MTFWFPIMWQTLGTESSIHMAFPSKDSQAISEGSESIHLESVMRAVIGWSRHRESTEEEQLRQPGKSGGHLEPGQTREAEPGVLRRTSRGWKLPSTWHSRWRWDSSLGPVLSHEGRAGGESPRGGANRAKWRVERPEVWPEGDCGKTDKGMGTPAGLSFLLWDLTSGTDTQGAKAGGK